MSWIDVRTRAWIVGLAVACGLPGVAAAGDDDAAASPWRYRFYVDAGFGHSTNEPSDGTWRSKSTTNVLNEPELFLAMGTVQKEPTFASRWGFEFGLQTGVDSEGLVTAPPPPALTPVSNADSWRHLYRANVSYRFDAGRGLRLTGGLINSYIGYESFLSFDNPNYTRAYATDLAPYFLFGVEAVWDVSDRIDVGFYLTTGYNYLTHPNDVPNPGLQVDWKVSRSVTVTQNLYYGPDQSDTSIEFWRFLSDTIVEWSKDRFVLAGVVDFGTEKQAELPTRPRYDWAAAALWARWQFLPRWSVALRPEVYRDRDGLITGAVQTIRASTGTVKYERSFGRHRFAGAFELRYDRSTGEDGGFFDAPDDRLVPDQTIAFVGLLWSFDGSMAATSSTRQDPTARLGF